MDLNQIEKVITDNCRLNKEKPVLVGVSGGADSLCLLHLLNSLGYKVIAANVNHQLRPEANEEATIVRQYCHTWQIRFIYLEVDVLAMAKRDRLSIEESARILRYSTLLETAVRESAQALAVAHQADDQVETILMHILRGSGMSGLKGMAFRSFIGMNSNEIPLVRPLLGVWRKEIDQYCVENKISPCEDKTNTDPAYFRNRIRHELVPTLQTYNSQSTRHIWLLSQIVTEEDRYLDEITKNAIKKIQTESGPGFFVLDRIAFAELDVVIRRRLTMKIFSILREDIRDIGFEAIEKAERFISNQDAKGEQQILEGVHVLKMNQNLALVYTEEAEFDHLWPLINKGKPIELIIPGETVLNAHWKLRTEVISSKKFLLQKDIDHAYFDFDQLEYPLQVGTHEKGEKFSPFGMVYQTVKIGDYFTNNHCPKLARSQWPILRMGDQILWIVGMRQSSAAAVTEMTDKVLTIQLIRVE
ncbi:MAG: tRNA lysidine(34) synthetase TilS [Anaerolineaceae bacterium]